MEINILLLMVLVLLLAKVCDGYKNGMVREIISFVSLIFLCLIVVFIGNGLIGYIHKDTIQVAVMILLLAILGILHYVVNVVVFPAKMITKLPIVKSVDKLLGIVVGVLETVLIVWTIYTFNSMMNLGAVGDFIEENTAKSIVLTWLSEYNQLVVWLDIIGAKLSSIVQIHLNNL